MGGIQITLKWTTSFDPLFWVIVFVTGVKLRVWGTAKVPVVLLEHSGALLVFLILDLSNGRLNVPDRVSCPLTLLQDTIPSAKISSGI
jgi:hypothetical protein